MDTREQIDSDLISRSVQNMLFYRCAKCGAFITKCTRCYRSHQTNSGWCFISKLVTHLTSFGYLVCLTSTSTTQCHTWTYGPISYLPYVRRWLFRDIAKVFYVLLGVQWHWTAIKEIIKVTMHTPNLGLNPVEWHATQACYPLDHWGRFN